ncbi:putative V-type proton ATPase 21 kDa proteolipid subunit [Sesbania bispinosa]|nr:putative V-type proton ATPase 21 kDa proteolipid subunit [Sesbania bispinosa]
MVTTRSTTNVAATGRHRSASAGPSNNRQKSPPTMTVVMAVGISTVISVLGAPAVASTAGVSVLGSRVPLAVPRP